MKGIIGSVKCDTEGCHQMFILPDMEDGHANSLNVASQAERAAVEEGWTIDRRGRLRHHCPPHSQQRAEAQAKKANKYVSRNQ